MRIRIFVSALVAGLTAIGSAQSIYVDLDTFIGGEQLGEGPPSSSFGGAAGVPGTWNAVPGDSGGPVSLHDTAGNSTSVVMTWSGGAGVLGYNNPNLSGDYAYLLKDADAVGAGGLRFTLTGLAPGQYRIFTYAVEPQGEAWTTQITIPGSVQGTVDVTGPLPPNQLIEGITHSVHDIDFSGGSLLIRAEEHWPKSYVNGFQIQAVPEPASVAALAAFLPILVRKRRAPRIGFRWR